MVFIVTALKIEAEPLIEHFNLKKDMDIHLFPVYRNPDITLIISGVGKVKSAMAVTYLLSTHQTTLQDVLLNIGFCGTNNRKYSVGTMVAVNKVTDMDTNIDYYPDVFIKENIPFAGLCCYSRPVAQDMVQEEKEVFCDMESAGIMEASKKFYYAHQVILLKIISDYLNPEKLDKFQLKNFIKKSMPLIEKIIQNAVYLNNSFKGMWLDENEISLIDTVSQNLRFSKTMEKMLFKNAVQAKVKGIDVCKTIYPFLETKVNSKLEGKRIFEKIQQQLK
ncbi:MAG TPA: nucleoside phosphorylase [Acetivibrio saccincola]|uniref:5'-methylthioadenosine/S-adenosylhomocysteine nucleosidase family protein n=1 Tax=Acetivibrio saccincola TaxID=1677857 RepID=UPI002CE20763|nr:nucleoside phosphorylase [Acetivibrio saccincola]HOA96164.1 nucleoside phosphorylase [Acetivibrio saccincola]HQD28297.1 nucleoside phosphorylase [Acetivibrio saccincola]